MKTNTNTEELKRILYAAYARGQLSGVDGKEPQIYDWLKMLEQYTENMVLKARLDELKPVSFRIKDALSVSAGPRVVVRTHLTDEFIDKRIAKLQASLNNTEGK